MKGKITSYDPRRGVAEVATKHGTLEVRWNAIRRSGFVPDPGEEVEVQLDRGTVQRLRRVVVTGKT